MAGSAWCGSLSYPGATLEDMCRSIKTLRSGNEVAGQEEIQAAALQFVRKVSGYRTPSRDNADAFDLAVEEVAEASRKLLERVAASPHLRAPRTPLG